LWKKIAWGLSAGRVQSVATLVNRERERRAFHQGSYWDLGNFTAGKHRLQPGWSNWEELGWLLVAISTLPLVTRAQCSFAE